MQVERGNLRPGSANLLLAPLNERLFIRLSAGWISEGIEEAFILRCPNHERDVLRRTAGYGLQRRLGQNDPIDHRRKMNRIPGSRFSSPVGKSGSCLYQPFRRDLL